MNPTLSDLIHSLAGEIMNIPANSVTIACSGWTDDEVKVYKIGHRDARHAAVELVLAFANKMVEEESK